MDGELPVGALLREWRHRRKLSQLDLALEAEVSTRHISFVETGRTIPSRSMVLHLAEHLNVPLRDRNRLLTAAGHAPEFRRREWDDPALERAREAVARVLRLHQPYPALLEPPVNMMRLGLHPKGFAPRLGNPEQVRAFLLPRL
ncbi:helix-turn-helix transcriptional regulator [Nocardia uniformis]|uniref:helix-turn-helix transcriptional regulator n=1 Tax=Nocardia uniformis TaxID=53432 RepID=UPI000AA4B73F|nr:helix-turn-helix transcriptional regulator [Nocardia uniformis]